jgi:serine/threonine-protein kinase
MRRIALWVLAALLVALVGCARASEHAQSLDAWTLSLPGDPAGSAITFPTHVGSIVGTTPSYVLRSHVSLRPDMAGAPLTLTIAWLPTLVSLRVDGREVSALDAPIVDRYRSAGPHRWRIPDDLALRDELDLELRVENTWTGAWWLDAPPRLSRTPTGEPWFLAVYALNESAVAAGVITNLLLALLYAAMFLSDRTRVQDAWFALEGLGAISYPAIIGGLGQAVLGRAELPVGAVSLAVAAVAGVHFTHAYCRWPPPSRLWWAAIGALVILAIFRGGPFTAVAWLVPGVVAVLLANSAYQVYVLAKVLRSGAARPTSLLIVTLSWPVAATLSASDFAWWLGFGDPFGGLRVGGIGVVVAGVVQAVRLAREHARSLHDVAQLNEELRRQVMARSRQLADALARLGAASRTPVELSRGQTVDGRYNVVRAIGEGAMGRVYEVERRNDGQRFAMKVMTDTADARQLARAAREAQLASTVRHPNVVTIVDVDVSSDGFFFLVMELVEGRSLRDEKAQFGRAAWALPILRQVAEGLAAIHACGIVHRDLKPANVLLTGVRGNGEPVAKIADFGISGLVDSRRNTDGEETAALSAKENGGGAHALPHGAVRAAEESPLTQTGDILGTPHYMAPEVVPQGVKEAQTPADVFAFGVIAYELLAGRRPFADMPTYFGVAVSDPPASLRVVCAGLPSATADLLDSCLSRDRRDRPTASELARSLAEACATGR